MAQLHDVMAYVCQNYPHKRELTKAKLAKIIYLADWRFAVERGEQITGIEWQFNHYGPYVSDVVDTARGRAEFTVEADRTFWGNPKEVIRCNAEFVPDLTSEEREALDVVMSRVAPLPWDPFIKLVYSTYPILVSDRGAKLNLPELAERYRATREAS